MIIATEYFYKEINNTKRKFAKYLCPSCEEIKIARADHLKKLKVCKKDGLKNGAVFATKHARKEWATIQESGKLLDEWKTICPSGAKKINKMKEKDIKNLYDFVWKFASDGEVPSCG